MSVVPKFNQIRYAQFSHLEANGTHGGNRIGDENWAKGGATGTVATANRYYRRPITDTITSSSFATLTPSGSGASTTSGGILLEAGTYRANLTVITFYSVQQTVVLCTDTSVSKGASTSPDGILLRMGTYNGFTNDPGTVQINSSGIFELTSTTRVFCMQALGNIHVNYANGIATSQNWGSGHYGNEHHLDLMLEKLD